MREKRPNCLTILVLPLVAVLCLAGVVGAYAVFSLPGQAEEVFGLPAPNLSQWQQIQYAALLMGQADSLTVPLDATSEEVDFVVAQGESVTSITRRLTEQGLISNPGGFRTFLQYTGIDVSIQAGDYQLSPAMAPIEIARSLQDATPTELPFRILAGWRLEEIAEAMPTSGLNITPEDFLLAAQRRAQNFGLSPDLPSGASLEGFLYPDMYTIPREATADDLIATFTVNFEANLDLDLVSAYNRQGLTLFQAITLASIIEREAIVPEESPLIASVFLNRLAIGMKLDADPTVQYALGYNTQQGTWWTNPLSLADLEFDSPYNTYLYTGFPPGPISNPGPAALRAVAFPAQTPYYYFRAACDGSQRHVFARTFEEHKANACQ
jgi:UPF0755 protein